MTWAGRLGAAALVVLGLGAVGALTVAVGYLAFELRAATTRVATLEAQVREGAGQLRTVDAEVDQLRGEGWLKVRYRPITLGLTGNELCGEEGEVCVAVTPAEAHVMTRRQVDADGDGLLDSFWGWSTFDCNSRVTATRRCRTTQDGRKHPYMIDRSRFRRSPRSSVTATNASDVMCLSEPRYDFAACAILTPNPAAGG